METDYKTEVAAGSAYLDRVAPGWYMQINTDTLNVAASDRCIGGQLYGHYTNMPQFAELGGVHQMHWAVEHGFNVPLGYTFPANVMQVRARRYAQLTKQWILEIVRRKQADNDLAIARLETERQQAIDQFVTDLVSG